MQTANDTRTLRRGAGADLSPELVSQLQADEWNRARARAQARARERLIEARRAAHEELLDELSALEARHARALVWYQSLTPTTQRILRALLEPHLPTELRRPARARWGARERYQRGLEYRLALVEHVGRVHALVVALEPGAGGGEPQAVELVADRVVAAGLRPGPLWALAADGGVIGLRRSRPGWGWRVVGEVTGEESAEDLAALLRRAVAP